MAFSNNPNFVRASNFEPIAPDNASVLNNVISNLWQITTIKDGEWLAAQIFPKSEWGNMSDHFASKLCGYMADKDVPTAVIWWIGGMSEEYRLQVYAWLNARQF